MAFLQSSRVAGSRSAPPAPDAKIMLAAESGQVCSGLDGIGMRKKDGINMYQS